VSSDAVILYKRIIYESFDVSARRKDDRENEVD